MICAGMKGEWYKGLCGGNWIEVDGGFGGDAQSSDSMECNTKKMSTVIFSLTVTALTVCVIYTTVFEYKNQSHLQYDCF
jgi:hypothetical protein